MEEPEDAPRRSLRNRAADMAVVLVAVASVIGFGFAVDRMTRAGDEAATFATAQVCPGAQPRHDAGCLSQEDATVVAKASRRTHGPDRLEVQRAAQSTWIDFDHGPGDALLDRLRPHDTVTLALWHGSIVAVSGHGTAAETREHPSVVYRHGKVMALYVLSLLMFSVPLAAITLTRKPARRIGRRPWAVFSVVFFPIGGLVLLATAWPLSDGMSSPWGLSIACLLYALDACVATWCARHARRWRDSTSSTATALAAARLFAGRRR